MDHQIIRSTASLASWLQTPAGQYMAAWESEQFDRVVADVFGFHGLQLGLSPLPVLRNSRIRHCWVAENKLSAHGEVANHSLGLYADSVALPFTDQSLDLVVLPHTLELSIDPHATLREVERVLVPEGRVIISGFNPMSLWGLRQQRSRWFKRWGAKDQFVPDVSDWMAYWRLRDWLRLLDLEVEAGYFGGYRPMVRSEALVSMSVPPARAATSICRASFAKSFPRALSAAPFLCLIVAHLECPDMVTPFLWLKLLKRKTDEAVNRRLVQDEKSTP